MTTKAELKTKNSLLYEELGGIQACRRVSERFHHRVAADPVLSLMFPKNLTTLAEHFALFLAETLGGPADYTAKRGKPRLVCRHAHLPIGTPEVTRWLGHMQATLEEENVPGNVRQHLQHFFGQTAPTLSDPFITFYQMPLDGLEALLELNPALASWEDEGRSLFRDAAGRWDVPRVELLLRFGANASLPEPLYRAANALARGREDEGCAVVTLLLKHGAEVNGRNGVGQMTPLHMAARRGTIALAEVLLAAGADVEALDTKGETPLRRAVNCGHAGLVRVLLAHGANPLSRDKQGRSVLDAARHEPIREALQQAR